VGRSWDGRQATWDTVVSVRSYHVIPARANAIPEDSLTTVHDQFGTRILNHYPVWPAIAVPILSLPDMLIELEVVAFG
jgi:enamine deaminase RidA (YjgF/YER057c/UK114 family)